MHTSETDILHEPTALAAYRRLMRFLAGTSMLAIVVIMVVQVFARYVLNASLIWAEELCRYILVWRPISAASLSPSKFSPACSPRPGDSF
jgi:TRAP-type C4-dicarboxylate transport system permease small subunit